MQHKLKDLLDMLGRDKNFMSCVTNWQKIARRDGVYEQIPADINPQIREALKRVGVTRLYAHQYRSYQEVRAGNNIVVVTPTASGKTLCYNLPVIQSLLENNDFKALYLFPTKALSQDQQAELNEIALDGKLPLKIFTYDGDTPRSIRVSARDQGRIIISNPDMLHTGILPNHPKWIKFLKSLAFVIIDEVHIYRGVFGSHMTNVIRRLKRIARFYGREPQFICCSATIGNPLQLAQRIIENKAILIDKNGAPSGEKHIILYNPPLLDKVQGIRRGVVLEAQKLATLFLKAGIKTIVFARSRIRTELISSYIKSQLKNIYSDNHRLQVESYRGGYLPNERRAIEKGLREGYIQGVVSTNALELGIDIGGLDTSILAGFPGSISSSWQQAGRAGRNNTLSVAIIIASASPLNQFLIQHPQYFFSQSPESGWIDPNNMYILLDHLKCALFELPFKEEEGFPGPVTELLTYLEENGVIRFAGDSWYWADRSYPAEGISLRSATAENVVIVDTTKGKNEVIGEMDRPSAKMLLFDNAVYLHRSNQYIVKNLDIEEKRCYVEQTAVNYYTDSIVKTDIKVLHIDRETEQAGALLKIGDILVRTQVTKFKKIRYHTHENVGNGDISLPEEEMHTRGLAIVLQESNRAGIAFHGLAEELKTGVIAGLGYLIKNVAPFFLLCDTNDIGIAERLKDQHFNHTTLYVFDSYPGGTGLAEGFLENIENILSACRQRVNTCACQYGCPACIGAQDTVNKPAFNIKQAIRNFFKKWLDAQVK